MLSHRMLMASAAKRPFLYDFSTMSALSSEFNFDRGAAGEIFDSTLSLAQKAIDVPRFEYDPYVGTPLGLMIERSRTNSIRNNTMVGASVPSLLPTNWQNNGTLNTTIAVVGTGTEIGVPYIDIRWNGVPNATSNIRLAFETTTGVVAATAQVWALSSFMRVVAGSLTNITGIYLVQQERTAAGVSVTTGQSPDLAGQLGGTFNRLSYVRTLNGGATIGANQPELGIGVTNGAAIDVTLRIGLPQLELSEMVGSPIKTSGAAATRNGELCELNNGQILRHDIYGTWVLKARTPAAPGGSTTAWFLAWDGTATNRIAIIYNASGVVLCELVGGTLSGSVNLGTPGPNVDIRIAMRLQANSFAASLNGGAVVTDTTVDMPPLTFTEILIGRYTTSTRQINAPIKSLEILPGRADNATLQALSA